MKEDKKNKIIDFIFESVMAIISALFIFGEIVLILGIYNIVKEQGDILQLLCERLGL